MVKRRISKRYIILLFDFLFGRLAEAGIFLDKIVTDSSLFKVIFSAHSNLDKSNDSHQAKFSWILHHVW